MPKGRRKGKTSERSRAYDNASSDDESLNDNASVISGYSEARSAGVNDDEEVDTFAQNEEFEDKLTEAIDGCIQKSAQGRTQSFEAVCRALLKKYIPELIENRQMTLCDYTERGLRKGRGDEQISAAWLASLLCVQLGSCDCSDDTGNFLRPILSLTYNDASMSHKVRAKCCASQGLCMFLCGGEIADVIRVMRELETIFSGSYLRGDGTVANVAVETSVLHAAALSAWSLLLTLLEPGDVYTFLNDYDNCKFSPSLEQLSEMLLSPHLDVRLSAGEALALVYEIGRDCNEDFGEVFTDELASSLKQLATDSHKYRAKKDRKQQRATFRDVLHWIEDNEPSSEQIRLGGHETLVLDSWVRRRQYDALCMALGPGLSVHLATNDLLRDIFQMGDRREVLDESVNKKRSKVERQLLNAANFKARTIARGKNRDKRSAVAEI